MSLNFAWHQSCPKDLTRNQDPKVNDGYLIWNGSISPF
jgi:hypothetical protein